MTVLYEIRQRLVVFYSKYEWYLKPAVKFMHAYLVLYFLGEATGYFPLLSSPLVYLMLSVGCAFLPSSGITIFSSLYLVLQMSQVSVELAIVTVCILLFMILLYFIFKCGNSMLMSTSLLSCICKGPGVFMVGAGLGTSPGAIIPACFGVILNAFVSISKSEYSVLFSQTSALSSMERFSYVLNKVVQNQYMWLMICAMIFVMAAVYGIRRMKVNYSWMLAIGSGSLIYLIIMLVGIYAFDVGVSIPGCMVNTLLAVAVGMVLHLFLFSVDYTRTEYVQFEDEEYYYYVKAVPKITVTLSNKKVKHITEVTDYIAEELAMQEQEPEDYIRRQSIADSNKVD